MTKLEKMALDGAIQWLKTRPPRHDIEDDDAYEQGFIEGFKSARGLAIENYGNLPVIGSRGYFHYLCEMGNEEA